MAKRRFHWSTVFDCVMQETDENGDTIVEYTHEPSQFGPLLSESRDGVESYHHYDALGSTMMLTDDAGDVTDTFAYDAWGDQVASTGTTETPYTWVGRWGYQNDSTITGGYYIRARSYQPTVARWMRPDPIFKQRLYIYSNNRVTLVRDPTGYIGISSTCCECEMSKLFANEEGITIVRRRDSRNPKLVRECRAFIECKEDGCGGPTGCGHTKMDDLIPLGQTHDKIPAFNIKVCVSCHCEPALLVIIHEMQHVSQACAFDKIVDCDSCFRLEKQAATYHCVEAATQNPGFDIAKCIECSVWLSCYSRSFKGQRCVYNPDNLPNPAPPACTCADIGLTSAPAGLTCDPRQIP